MLSQPRGREAKRLSHESRMGTVHLRHDFYFTGTTPASMRCGAADAGGSRGVRMCRHCVLHLRAFLRKAKDKLPVSSASKNVLDKIAQSLGREVTGFFGAEYHDVYERGVVCSKKRGEMSKREVNGVGKSPKQRGTWQLKR